MSGPAASSSACSSSPRGGMRNTCGRSAILFLFSEREAGFCGAAAHPEPVEE